MPTSAVVAAILMKQPISFDSILKSTVQDGTQTWHHYQGQ